MWRQVVSGNIPEGVELIGFDHKWVNADFNPEGLRVCFFNDGEWISAYWNDYQDTYQNSNDVPFLYRPMPASPKGILALCPVCGEDLDPSVMSGKIKVNEKPKKKQIRSTKEMSEPEKIRTEYRNRKVC